MKYILALLISLLLGCAVTMQTLDVTQRSRTFNNNYPTIIKAINEYCIEKGFAITTMDRENGIVNTDYKEGTATSKLFFGNTRAKINFSISKISDDSTKVTLLASTEEQRGLVGWQQMTMNESSAQDFYNQIFDGITKNIK
jgi:hypothetical protein